MDSVNVRYLRANRNRQQRNPSFAQSVLLLGDEVFIVRCGEGSSEIYQAGLQLAQLGIPVGPSKTFVSSWQIAVAVIVQVQAGTRDPMLVTIDTVKAPHKHETHASGVS